MDAPPLALEELPLRGLIAANTPLREIVIIGDDAESDWHAQDHSVCGTLKGYQ